ncbi:uncharacterized protein TRAVEDRAFT_49142 [Trametes versicolor FP-101664 SS1]|uniref:uncharacterized protein n=1 Tax=Trametes versicolor (strain FP-101664) TaxID=717944 RepID=UPI000462178F|nr:uncharacterized protein TRAVEDRAFT_49142 [Trametes versicolor FP-101664 SS1]EIW56309.1 hypothetical protein TRAVEDRAFT_49142 [Trametes versicolor FP-101664 SS1]
MSYDYGTYPIVFSIDNGTASTFGSIAYGCPGDASLEIAGSQGPGWDSSAGGSFSSTFDGYTSDEFLYSNLPPDNGLWIDQVTTHEPSQMEDIDNPELHLEDVMDVAGENGMGSFGALPTCHAHARAVSSDTSYPVPLPPSSYQPSVQVPSSVILPAFSPPSRQCDSHRHPYAAKGRLPRPAPFLRQYAPTPLMPVSSFDKINTSQWSIPQHIYRGNQGDHRQPDKRFAAIDVNVSAKVALIPEALAVSLLNPLEPAFVEADRKSKKWTYRYQFIGSSNLQNAAPQMHEYASGDQRSKAVAAAMRLPGNASQPSTSFATPLKRAAVVEKVAHGLAVYMEKLKDEGSPLRFNGHEVDFDHLQILKIFRPTPASMQPILEICEEFRGFYARTST